MMLLMKVQVAIGLLVSRMENTTLTMKSAVRPFETYDSFLEELLEYSPQQSSRELALSLSVSYNTVLNRLNALGKVSFHPKFYTK